MTPYSGFGVMWIIDIADLVLGKFREVGRDLLSLLFFEMGNQPRGSRDYREPAHDRVRDAEIPEDSGDSSGCIDGQVTAEGSVDFAREHMDCIDMTSGDASFACDLEKPHRARIVRT